MSPIKYEMVQGEVIAIRQESSQLQIDVEYRVPRFLRQSTLETRSLVATGSVARSLVYWVYVGGTWNFQVEQGTDTILGISVV